MYDVTVLEGRGQGFCDNSTKPLVIKSVMGEGGQNSPKLCDVICARPLTCSPGMIIRVSVETSFFSLSPFFFFKAVEPEVSLSGNDELTSGKKSSLKRKLTFL
jgi:hypothetical protein